MELDNDEIEEMLNFLLEKLTGDILGFVESLNEQFTQRGSLSLKQQEALKKIYDNSHR